MIRLFFMFLCVFWGFSAFADDPVDCTDSWSTHCQAQFAQMDFQRADKELNEQYKRFLNTLSSSEEKKKLVDAQRAWIIYRDKLCEFENVGGGIESINWISCKARITNQRLNDLKAYIENPLN